MDARKEWLVEPAQDKSMRDEIWLLGQPSLEKYLEYVEDKTIGGQDHRRSVLVDEWRAANDYYYELEVAEAGLAEQIGVADLDQTLEPLAEAVTADPRFRRSFDTVPTRIAMVELDKLIVSQLHIDLHHHDRLKARLGRDPGPDSLFRFCLPLDRDEAPVDVRRTGPSQYTFCSASADLRFLEAALLSPDQVDDDDAHGRVGRVLGLLVGYSSNFLSAIESDGRLVLHNGYHRAYTLRALGITHAPCIVQTVTRRDELNIVATRDVVHAPAFYFKAARPPLLKDYFDPRIRKVFQVPHRTRMVEVNFEVRSYEVAC